jgi:hypothetical protein
MPVMIGLWVTLAVMEAREGFHGLRLDYCFALQEAGGGALEERSLLLENGRNLTANRL